MIIIRGPNNQCGPPAKRPRVSPLLADRLFYFLLLHLISLSPRGFPACVHAEVYPGSVIKCCFVASVPTQVTHTDVFAYGTLCKTIQCRFDTNIIFAYDPADDIIEAEENE